MVSDIFRSTILPILVVITSILADGPWNDCLAQDPPALAVTTIDHRVRRPFPQHIRYAPGTIRPNHLGAREQDKIVADMYDRWKKKYVVPVKNKKSNGPTMYRVTGGRRKPRHTFSEGQGYGMMIVAIMAGHDPRAKSVFDGLWAFARAHPSRIDGRLMAYKVPAPRNQSNSAFDGDCDIAYGLLLAHRQWGSAGVINYRAEALTMLDALLSSVIGPDSRLPMLGDWVKTNGRRYHQRTVRSSDIVPGHFRAFARAGNPDAWLQVLAASQAMVALIQSEVSPSTGLMPDFIVPRSRSDPRPKPAPRYFLEGTHDGRYYYNAARVPWRIGTDALVNGDPLSLAQTRKMAAWIVKATSGNPRLIKPGYRLDGRPLRAKPYFSKAFVAPFGVAAMTNPELQEFLNRTFDLIKNSAQDYYEDSLGLLCMLVMTRNFWDPKDR